MQYVYVIEKAPDGSYSAYVPDLPGCTTCGLTLGELKRNVAGAISLYLDSLREHGEIAPSPTSTADVVEYPDGDSDEFGRTGAALSALVLPAEDFTDWEVRPTPGDDGR